MQKEIQQHSKTNQGNNRIEKNKQSVILTNKGIEKQLDEERKVFLKEKKKKIVHFGYMEIYYTIK